MWSKTMGSNGKITLPKDAEGREIPLDTKVLYFKDGSEHRVAKWVLYPHEGIRWAVVFDNEVRRDPDVLYLTQPDTWEKLEEDLDNAANGGDNAECLYMRREDIEVGEQCSGCRLYNADDVFSDCSLLAYADIAARIRKLAAKDGE